MADQKATVPKFASFRPKQPPKEVAEKSKGDEELQERKDRDRSHRRERSHESSRRHYEDKSRHRRYRSRERHHKAKDVQKQAGIVPDAKELSRELFENASDLYRIDTKGDPDNVRYRKLHSYSVPGYKRLGYGAVLGAPHDQRIDRSIPEDKGIVLIAREREGKSVRGLLQKPRAAEERKVRLVRPEQEAGPDDHKLSFIELPRGKKRKRRSESPVVEHGEVDYRSIEGKAESSRQPVDPDVEHVTSSDEDDDHDDHDRAVRLRNAECSKRTRDEPQNLEAWLTLIEYQREVLGFSARELSHAKTRTLADIRISIYEQALAVVKDPIAKAKLTLGMLGEGANLWEAKQLARKWGEALHAFTNDASIWTAYLDFVQSSHAEFRYERCRNGYVKCLQISGKAMREAQGTSKAGDTSRILTYVFLRLTSMMRDAGYHEFAIALWQAVLELHFFRPHNLQRESELKESFEKFWEDEVPRIGEEDAKGWLNFTPDDQDAPEPITIEPETVEGTRRLFTRFAEAETKMADKLAMPGRSADGAGEDDPYHIVLFNDLSEVLFPAILVLEEKLDLVMAVLRFAKLPPLPSARSRSCEAWWLDPMLPHMQNSSILIPHHQTTTETLFDTSFDQSDANGTQWIRNVLATLVKACPEDDLLAEYHIALEFKLDPPAAAKLAKRLLKTRSSSLRLYNCYAIIESRLKGLEAGARVFSTAIAMSDNFSEQERRPKVLLYRTWIWEALRAGDVSAATGVLLTIGGDVEKAEEQTFSPATELRVTRWLQEGRDGMLSENESHLACLHIELLALLAYFRNVRSIESALMVYDTADELLNGRTLSGTPAHEALHQAKAQLIMFHLKDVHLYKPSLLRETLGRSIKLFPNYTILLGAYHDLGPGLNLLAPHSLMEDVVLAPHNATMIGYSFALSIALARTTETGGSPHTIRALFNRALNTFPHSHHLWEHYLSFELSRGGVAKARDVFMRGLRELPWCKWWVVKGLAELSDVIGFEEGMRVWRVLGEREVRVCVDVEEVVEGKWERRRADKERRMI